MSWFLAFAGFAVLIILHEFGHFIAAKWTGMRVERFFLFFPPKLVSRRIGETEYGIGAIPLGGFVKITGMNPDEVRPREAGDEREPHKPGMLEQIEGADRGPETPRSTADPEPLPPELLERAYYNQPVWKRIVVIAAGPVMNLLIAFVLLFFLAFGVEDPTSIRVDAIEKGSPAAAILEPEDRLVSVDGVPAPQPGSGLSREELDRRAERLSDQINTHACPGTPADGCRAATPVTLEIEREGRRFTIKERPFYDAENERNRLGFGFRGGDLVARDPSVPEAADLAVDQIWFVTSQTMTILARIFDAEQRKEISGVVGSYETTRQAIQFDTRAALLVLAIISLSLAIINLFPFLPLDGGHIFWSVVEKIRGQPVPFSVMERSSALGFMLVLVLFVIGLTNDIGRLTSGEGFDIR